MSDVPSEPTPSSAEYGLRPVDCPACGKPLGVLDAGRCPFCGKAIGAALSSQPEGPVPHPLRSSVPMVTDFGGPIPEEWNLSCVKCGYSLTGLTSRVCPECGRTFKPRDVWEINRGYKRPGAPEISRDILEPGETSGAAGPVRYRRPTVADPAGPIPAEWNLRCIQCGYILTGLTSRVCPECGRPFKPRETWEANRGWIRRIFTPGRDEGPAPETPVGAPVEMRLPAPTVTDFGEPIPPEWDLHCTKCDYNLTTLTSRVCPECGQPFKPRQTWEANRRRWRWTFSITKGEIAAGLVGGGAAGLLVWGDCPFVILIPLTSVATCVWILMELLAWAAGRSASHIRMLFGFFVMVIILKWVR